MQSVERFSSRVENYARYRPDYPSAIVDLLREECGLTSESIIADVGSGTGKLSELFLNNGNFVIGVEPNAAMRQAAESILVDCKNFRSIDGTAPIAVSLIVEGYGLFIGLSMSWPPAWRSLTLPLA